MVQYGSGSLSLFSVLLSALLQLIQTRPAAVDMPDLNISGADKSYEHILEKGLIIQQPWLQMIMEGKKIWEIRGDPSTFRGHLGTSQHTVAMRVDGV